MAVQVNTNNVKDKLQQKVENKPAPSTLKETSMSDLIQQMLPQIKAATDGIMAPDRFARIALSTYNGNKEFWNCSKKSFLSAMMMSAQAGLEPNTCLGEAYLIPYKGKISFQLGYKGILALAYRTNQYKAIYAHEVYANDKFEYSYGLFKNLVHTPADVPEGDPVYYYAVYHLLNGGYDFQVWHRDKVLNHAKQYSKTFSRGPWQESFDEMAKKTVLLAALKLAPKSIELSKALNYDNTVKEEIKEDMSNVDNVIDEIEFTVEEETNSTTT